MVAARDIYDRQAKERQREAGEKFHAGAKQVPVTLPEPSKGDSRDLAGKAVGVSGSYVDGATKVIEQAVPEVIKAVDFFAANFASCRRRHKKLPRDVTTPLTYLYILR